MTFRLRNKLLLFGIAASILPLGIAMSFTILRFHTIQTNTALERESQVARAASQEILNFAIAQFERTKEGTLIYPEVLDDPRLRDVFLERILFRNDDFMDVALVDGSGKEIARENRMRPILPAEFIDRSQSEEFLTTKKNGYYIGPIYFETGRPFFILGVASYDVRKQFRGAVFAQVDARIMQKVVREIFIVKEGKGRVYIVNTEGIVVAHPDISQVLAEKDFSGIPIVSALLKDSSLPLAKSYKNELGEEVLGAWSPIRMSFVEDRQSETRWYVIAEEPASFALRYVTQILWFTVGFFVIVFAAAIFAAVFFSRRIVRPIETVHRAVVQFGKGKFTERVSVQTGDEIKDLADGFNQMADKITVYTNTLKRERDQTSAIVSSLGDGLIMYNPEKEIIFLNPKAQEMLWVSPKQVLGKFLGNKNAFRTSLLENFYAISTLPLKNWETKEYTTEAPKKVVLEVTHIALEGPKGKNLGSMRVLHDITKEKEVEAIKSEFVFLASHQLRTPLSGMRWSLNMLLEGSFGKLEPKQEDIIGATLLSNDRLIGIVNDLLDVSRIEAGRFGYNFSSQFLEDLVGTLLKGFSHQIQIKKLQFFYEKPKTPLPKVSIDSEKMEMALQNIVDNAIKYTFEGGKIKIYFEKSATHLTFIVEDSGIGIPKAHQSRVFDKFFRARNAVKFQTEGSGLGLFIAKSIMEAHKGEISFVSEENKGSTFRISLPIDPKLMPRGRSGA